jgi:hypothetical protein
MGFCWFTQVRAWIEHFNGHRADSEKCSPFVFQIEKWLFRDRLKCILHTRTMAHFFDGAPVSIHTAVSFNQPGHK